MLEVEDAIYDALAANAGLTALVGARIYRGVAPKSAAYPHVTYQLTGGGSETDTPTDAASLLYLVQGITRENAATAEALAGQIHTALHRVELSVSGWTNIWTAVTNHLAAVELDAGSGHLIWQAGRFVRIRLSK